PSDLEPVALHVLSQESGALGRGLVARDPGPRLGLEDRAPPNRRYPPPGGHSRGGRVARAGAPRKREGSRRARDAGGPRTKRRRPYRAGGKRAGHQLHGGGALLACDAPGQPSRGGSARRTLFLRRRPGMLSRRNRERRSEESRDEADRGNGA